MKRLVILGSTGAVGQQALAVVRSAPERFHVVGLVAGTNRDLLFQQVQEFRPRYVSYLRQEGEQVIFPEGAEFLSQEEMVGQAEVDLVFVGSVGAVGLAPTLAAIRAGKPVALANTEVIVMAGELLAAEARRHRVLLLPVESETGGIWQCLRGESQPPTRVVLTSCWGPFRARALSQLPQVTPPDVLTYPGRWLGRKRRIDAATLMSKGLQVIQAHNLFGIPYGALEVLVHPQDVVRALVEFPDGSMKGVMAPPDASLWVHLALSYPDRFSNPQLPHFDLFSIRELTFEPLEKERFPCFQLAVEAGHRGGTYPAVLNAANEAAVSLFLNRQIGFPEIAKVVGAALERHQSVSHPLVDDILAADAWAREFARRQVQE
ncbi:MAG: 1-deoxy-D-xylulose-5-phosphate reductoisomerase [Chloroflexi bacterium]|nr:1-deoxy-D-xylulose-5-phosphate reductoisomerase [Chloroflexota bacterium]